MGDGELFPISFDRITTITYIFKTINATAKLQQQNHTCCKIRIASPY